MIKQLRSAEDLKPLTYMQKLFCFPKLYVYPELTNEDLAMEGGLLASFDGEYAWGASRQELKDNIELFKNGL